MEIIELKSAWDLWQQEVIQNDTVSENSISASVHHKSKSEISKIKRGLHLKFIMASIAIIVAVGLGIMTSLNPAMNPLDKVFSTAESVSFFLAMATAVSIMVYFNYQAYTQIQAIERSSSNLKENLSSFIEAMKKAIAFNIYSETLITPLIVTWIYYAFAFEKYSIGFNIRTAFLLALPIVIGRFSYFLQQYMQQLKFGKFLQRLEDYLESLKNI